jgi:diadenosine tetraphosphatase ApaH/serine/threonine PP2A family protein phosphatase
VYFVHASPRDPITEYVEESDTVDMGFGPSEKIIQIMSMVERLCFIGHSHKHGIVTAEHKWLSMKDLPENTFRLPAGAKALVNVGSVGQPRDGDWRACYVLWDGDTVVFRRVDYDIQSTIARIRAIPLLHEKLAQRLLAGK